MFGWLRGRTNSVLADVASELRALRELSETSHRLVQVAQGEPEGNLDLVRRLEALEGRFEELRGQCLRHLQSASQRLKLAERKEAELEDDPDFEGAPANGAQIPIPGVQPEPELSDHEWAKQQIIARGETPV